VLALLLAGVVTVAVAGIESAAGAATRVPLKVFGTMAVPAGNNVAKVTWDAPGDGGSPILGYTVTPFIGAKAQTPVQYGTKTTEIVSGLQNGASYHFLIAARNALGTGPSAVATKMSVGAPLKPHAPGATSVAPGQLQVTFKAPNNGGAPITSYSVACNILNNYKMVSASGPPKPFKGGFVIYVNGLKAGKTYQCRVKATNSRGSGVLSARSPFAHIPS
jgi:hypothetical protein